MATREQRMADVVIENPILNGPFREPARHFRFADEGITNEIVPGRRSSSYFIPIARPKKKGKQLAFETEWTQDRIEENKAVNRIRQRVGLWREGGHVGVTPTTASLLRYWTDPDRDRKRAPKRVIFLPVPLAPPGRGVRGEGGSRPAAAHTSPKRKRGILCSCGEPAQTSPNRKRGIFC
jgi:hypothetical protein